MDMMQGCLHSLLPTIVLLCLQYPKALGNTVAELKEVLSANSPIIEKTRFSMVTQEVHDLLKQKSPITQVGQLTGQQRPGSPWHTSSAFTILANSERDANWPT